MSKAIVPLILALSTCLVLAQDLDDRARISINRALEKSTVLIASSDRSGKGGIGSGFVASEEGLIVTNYHVISSYRQGATIAVRFKDSEFLPAEVVAEDPANDLALLRIVAPPAGIDLHPLPLGDSDAVAVGQTVLAKGNPYGLEGTLSQGIVSAVRNIPSPSGGEIRGAIQTDAAIGQGNSGGPLVNARGEVIGVISATLFDKERAAGVANINFAVPVNRAKELIASVRSGRSAQPVARRPIAPPQPVAQSPAASPSVYLGISGIDYEKGNVRGVKIVRIEPQSPAQEAGLRSDDDPLPLGSPAQGRFSSTGHIIIAVDGKPVRNLDDLEAALAGKRPGDLVALTVLCCDESIQSRVHVRLGESAALRARQPSSRDPNIVIGGSGGISSGGSASSGSIWRPGRMSSKSRGQSSSSIGVKVIGGGAPRGQGGSQTAPQPVAQPPVRVIGPRGSVYLGVEVEDYNSGAIRGVKIVSVDSDSPAAISGLRSDSDPLPRRAGADCSSTGHIIVSIDGEKVNSSDDMDRILAQKAPDQIVDFGVVSCDGKLREVIPVKLGRR